MSEMEPAPDGVRLTDRQTAALLCAYDAERERGTRAEAEVRDLGLIDDDGTTPRGAALAEEIRARALRLWRQGERAPVVTVVVGPEGHHVAVDRSGDAEAAEDGAPEVNPDHAHAERVQVSVSEDAATVTLHVDGAAVELSAEGDIRPGLDVLTRVSGAVHRAMHLLRDEAARREAARGAPLDATAWLPVDRAAPHPHLPRE